MNKKFFLKSLAAYLRLNPDSNSKDSQYFEELLDLAFENMVFKNLEDKGIDKLMSLMENGRDEEVLAYLDQNIPDWRFKLHQIIFENVR